MLNEITNDNAVEEVENSEISENNTSVKENAPTVEKKEIKDYLSSSLCLLYTSPSPRDRG